MTNPSHIGTIILHIIFIVVHYHIAFLYLYLRSIFIYLIVLPHYSVQMVTNGLDLTLTVHFSNCKC